MRVKENRLAGFGWAGVVRAGGVQPAGEYSGRSVGAAVTRENRVALCAGIRFVISIAPGALAPHRPGFGLLQAVRTARSGRWANRIPPTLAEGGWQCQHELWRFGFKFRVAGSGGQGQRRVLFRQMVVWHGRDSTRGVGVRFIFYCPTGPGRIRLPQ